MGARRPDDLGGVLGDSPGQDTLFAVGIGFCQKDLSARLMPGESPAPNFID